jgi:hypothetical protein
MGIPPPLEPCGFAQVFIPDVVAPDPADTTVSHDNFPVISKIELKAITGAPSRLKRMDPCSCISKFF